MAIIEEIEWLDIDAGEAVVTIKTSNDILIDCFAFPFNGCTGDVFFGEVSSLDAVNLMKIEIGEFSATKMQNKWGYHIIARIVDINNSLIELDDILIEVEYALYGDAKVGDWISVDITRLSI